MSNTAAPQRIVVGVNGLVLGSVSHACIREATCPVVVVPDAAA